MAYQLSPLPLSSMPRREWKGGTYHPPASGFPVSYLDLSLATCVEAPRTREGVLHFQRGTSLSLLSSQSHSSVKRTVSLPLSPRITWLSRTKRGRWICGEGFQAQVDVRDQVSVKSKAGGGGLGDKPSGSPDD